MGMAWNNPLFPLYLTSVFTNHLPYTTWMNEEALRQVRAIDPSRVNNMAWQSMIWSTPPLLMNVFPFHLKKLYALYQYWMRCLRGTAIGFSGRAGWNDMAWRHACFLYLIYVITTISKSLGKHPRSGSALCFPRTSGRHTRNSYLLDRARNTFFKPSKGLVPHLWL